MLTEKLFWDQDCPSLDHKLNLQKCLLKPQFRNSSIHLIFFIFILTEYFFILLNEASRSIAIRCHLEGERCRDSWVCYESSSLLCTVAEPLWARFVSFCISRFPMSSDRWCSIDVKLHFAAHSAISQIWITSSVKYFKAEIAKIKSTPKVRKFTFLEFCC